MRIVAGRFRGLTLAAVGSGDPAAHLRPTTDRTRESLFNHLTGGAYADPITDARVLDLFAGTGALGLEALSRGASHVTFVENGRKAQALIRENIAKTRTASETTLIARDAARLPPATEAATLIFLDPPYGKSLGTAALASAVAAGWVAPGALIVWEENGPQPPPPGMTRETTRGYGDTTVTILRALR